MKKWKTLESKLAFNNKWFKVRQEKVQLPNGEVIDDYFMWEEGDVVLVVPITKNQEFVMERQYKHARKEIMIEFPAGLINKNESPLQAAKRELLEETGIVGKLKYLAKITNNPTKEIGDIHIFIAHDLKYTGQKLQEITEEIETIVIPISKVFQMIKSGEIWVTGSISAAYLVKEKLKQ